MSFDGGPGESGQGCTCFCLDQNWLKALRWPVDLATLVEDNQAGDAGITDQDIGAASEQQKRCPRAMEDIECDFKVGQLIDCE